MVRWLRRRAAEQHYKRIRAERILSEIRRELERRLYQRTKRMLYSRLLRNYNELMELHRTVQKLVTEARRRGYRHPYLYAVREYMLQNLVDDDLEKLIRAKRFTQALLYSMLRSMDVDVRVVEDRLDYDLRSGIYNSLGLTREKMAVIRSMLRYFSLVRKVTAFLRNPSIRTMNEAAQSYEYFKQILNLPPFSHLIYHDYCVATRDLVKFDFVLPSRIYLAVSYAKITYNVIATFGLFVAMLALVGNLFQKMDGDWVTSAKVATDQASSLQDRVAVIRTDDGRYAVSYPLFFVLERPDRVEKWAAKALGRREMVDVTVHCSVYRDPIWRRGLAAPRLSSRVSKVRRLNVMLPLKWWGAQS